MVSLPERSVIWTKVSLKEAKMWATPKTFSPSATWGPRETVFSGATVLTFLGACIREYHGQRSFNASSYIQRPIHHNPTHLLCSLQAFNIATAPLASELASRVKNSHHWNAWGAYGLLETMSSTACIRSNLISNSAWLSPRGIIMPGAKIQVQLSSK